jgi:hypothetical protein
MTASEDEREDTTTVDGHAASVQQLPGSPDKGDEPPINGTDGTDKNNVDDSDDGDDSGKPKGKPKKKTPFWLELIILVAIAFVLTFLIQTFIARVFSIPSESMEQTLNGCTGCVGDRILVDKLTYDFSDPSPGDVIVFKGPPGWEQNEYLSQGSSNPVVQWFRELGSSVGIGAPPEYDLSSGSSRSAARPCTAVMPTTTPCSKVSRSSSRTCTSSKAWPIRRSRRSSTTRPPMTTRSTCRPASRRSPSPRVTCW